MVSIFDPVLKGIDFMIDGIIDLAKEQPKEDKYLIYEASKRTYNDLPYSGKTPEKYESFILRLSRALEI